MALPLLSIIYSQNGCRPEELVTLGHRLIEYGSFGLHVFYGYFFQAFSLRLLTEQSGLR